jgi:DNA transformation protein
VVKKSRTPKAPATRGQLRSLRVTDGFRAFVLEQLGGVGAVRARAMFGGFGLYANDVFFGILAADTLYLKVDDSNRGQYEAEGMAAFRPYAHKPMSMSYYQVPARVLEDSDELTTWARTSVRVATQPPRRKTRH